MRRLSPLLALTLLCGAACASTDDPPETASSFCERWAEAACNRDVVSTCQAASEDDCLTSQAAFCTAQLPSGEFSGARSDQCINAVRDAYADSDITADEISTVLRLGAPCDQLVRGPRAEGESCTTRKDCDAPDGYECIIKGLATTGICEQPVITGPGQDCSEPNAICTDGFYCNGDNCIAGERIGDECTSHVQCGGAGYCGLTSRCEARLPINSNCGFDEQCDSGICYTFSATERVCVDRLRLSRTEPICQDLR